MEGLEHLFSGLVQGVGETKLSLEKEKRERADKEQALQLQTVTQLLAQPGLKPEVRSDLFRMALGVASGGDKKVSESIFNVLGPMLGQEQAPMDGQTGGVRTSKENGAEGTALPQPVMQSKGEGGGASLPSSDLPKLGSSGSGGPSRSLFYTPEEETQQMVSRAGQVTSATAQAQSDVDMDAYRQKLQLEAEQKKKEGWKLTGFTSPNPTTGLSSAIYQNDLSQQVKIGDEQIPHFLTAEGINAIAVDEAQREQARQDAIKNIARATAADPSNISPTELKAAEKKWAQLSLQATEAGIGATKAGAFKDIATGTAAMDREDARAGITMQQQMLDYNRQRDEYEAQSQEIQKLVNEVNDHKKAASEAYTQAMTIKNYLESQKIDPNGSVNPDDADAVKNGMTPANFQLLMGQAKTEIDAARAAAQGASSRFGGSVEVGNLENQPGKWPYLKDIRGGFQYDAARSGFPAFPTMNNSSKKTKRTTGIEVPNRLLQELGLTP